MERKIIVNTLWLLELPRKMAANCGGNALKLRPLNGCQEETRFTMIAATGRPTPDGCPKPDNPRSARRACRSGAGDAPEGKQRNPGKWIRLDDLSTLRQRKWPRRRISPNRYIGYRSLMSKG